MKSREELLAEIAELLRSAEGLDEEEAENDAAIWLDQAIALGRAEASTHQTVEQVQQKALSVAKKELSLLLASTDSKLIHTQEVLRHIQQVEPLTDPWCARVDGFRETLRNMSEYMSYVGMRSLALTERHRHEHAHCYVNSILRAAEQDGDG